ncbi:hypothetical protein TERTU_2244 [Teredinibacter turnerae T7901]|uniref:Uncharacterized protein n=1 Tax=Teredinibacter turnerae (strain ATCC 39867 / T7901) TaxID=377629 RepID=C5BJM0_TERTT|nr:hypothetical protein TERTU_2244 [Teredinibacter turnerae T7901]
MRLNLFSDHLYRYSRYRKIEITATSGRLPCNIHNIQCKNAVIAFTGEQKENLQFDKRAKQ